MPEFVYNRTQHHVDRLKLLQKKGYQNLTESEREEYHGYASLGAYNYTDINRVENAVEEILSLYGYYLSFVDGYANRTNWSIPTRNVYPFNMNEYLSLVKRTVGAASDHNPELEFPELPDSMNDLTWEMANNIEYALYIAYVNAPGVTNRTAKLGTGKLGIMALGQN